MKTSKKSSLADHFSLANDELTHRTIATLVGEVGTGKTFFACTGPDPHVFQNIDQGTEGVIEQFRKDGKEIYEERYIWSPGEEEDEKLIKAMAIEVRDKVESDFKIAVKNGARSITWDTESRMWQVYRYASFGGPNSDDIKDYDKLNLRFETCINLAKANNVNFFLIRSMKDQWGMYGKVKADGKKGFGKGGREVWGYEHLPGCVFTELTFIHDAEIAEAQGLDDPYLIRIGKCRHNPKLQFTYVPRCSFPSLGEEMIVGSSEEDWL